MESYDLIIVGAGPAGLAAARTASGAGIRILIVDDNPVPGGQIWRQNLAGTLPPKAKALIDAVATLSNVSIMSQTRVVMFSGDNELLLENPRQGLRVGYRKLLLCTGARERLLPFPGWTLPGVTGAGGLQALIKSGLPVAGERIVIAGSGPLLLAAAATAKKAGADVVAVLEQASMAQVAGFGAQLVRWPGKLLQAFGLIHSGYRTNSLVTAVIGERRVESVRVDRGGKVDEIACDRLACGFGLVPNLQLAQGLGCAIDAGRVRVDEYQQTSVAACYAAGEATGFGGSELALVEGEIAAWHVIGDLARARALFPRRQHWRAFAAALEHAFVLNPNVVRLADDRTLVCRCEDVSYGQLQGFRGWRDAKLATRCGMGACQGRTCTTAAQTLFGWDAPAPRPPYTPTRVNTLALLPDRD